MSQTDEDDLTEYRSTTGAEVKTADVSRDDHPLKQEIGSGQQAQERIYDSTVAGERFVDFYDDSAASIREALANAETACIRRCENELLDAGYSEDDIPNNIADLVEEAKEVDYKPVIEVTYNRKSDEPRLTIEDNGIGISVNEYKVVQRVGYSVSHMDGEKGGQFGLGWLSLFQLTGVNGVFKMSTKSYLTDEAYSTQEYVANFEYLDYAPDTYGTRFEFPAFSESAKEINVPTKVEEYAEGMRVPVLYRDFDSSGQETGRSDDYLPRRIEDDYSDDSLVVSYENEFFKAVMSPSTPENRRNGDLITYNVTMPIRRNLDSWTTNDKFDAPWKWDFRGKREDGPIVKCESDENMVGLVPIENSKYDKLPPERQEKHVPMSTVPDPAIVMPGPASSRDSYMSGHDDFWRYVADRLNDGWADIASERFEELDSWDAFEDMSREEKEGLFRAYKQFGPKYSENDPDNIQETLEDAFGITVDTDICERLEKSRKSLMVVPRGHSQAHHKKPARRNKKRIWEIIDEAPDGIYMGKSVSQKKAEIAWGLGDTHVIRVDPADDQTTKERYAELEDLWGFDKLKDLPSSKLSEKLPNLDDDVADQWENADYVNNTSSSGSKRTSRDPTTKRITVRVGTGRRSKFSHTRVSDLEDNLDNDDTFRAGYNDCNHLLVYDQTKIGGTAAPTKHADSSSGIAAAAVPKYVYKYLKDVDNVYTDYDDLKESLLDDALDKFDTADIVYFVGDGVYKAFDDNPEDLAGTLNKHTSADLDEDASADIFKSNDLSGYSYLTNDDMDATVISVNGGYSTKEVREDYYSIDMVDVRLAEEVPDLDHDAPEFYQIFGRKRHLSTSVDKFHRGIEMVKAMGGTFPSQQDDQ